MEHKESFLKLKKKLHEIDQRCGGKKNPLFHSRFRGQRQVLRRKAERAALIYRIVRRERIRLFRDYISRLPLQTKEFYEARQ